MFIALFTSFHKFRSDHQILWITTNMLTCLYSIQVHSCRYLSSGGPTAQEIQHQTAQEDATVIRCRVRLWLDRTWKPSQWRRWHEIKKEENATGGKTVIRGPTWMKKTRGLAFKVCWWHFSLGPRLLVLCKRDLCCVCLLGSRHDHDDDDDATFISKNNEIPKYKHF